MSLPLCLTLMFPSASGLALPAADGKLGFGTNKPGFPGTDSYSYSSVDLFLAWNRELTPAEINIVYNDQV